MDVHAGTQPPWATRRASSIHDCVTKQRTKETRVFILGPSLLQRTGSHPCNSLQIPNETNQELMGPNCEPHQRDSLHNCSPSTVQRFTHPWRVAFRVVNWNIHPNQQNEFLLFVHNRGR